MSMRDTVERVLNAWGVEQRKLLPPNIARQIGYLNYSLYYGPSVPDEGEEFPYMGWEGGLKALRAALEDADIPNEVWVDYDCEEVLTSEPEGFYEDEDDEESWCEPNWECIQKCDNAWSYVVAGDELPKYL